MLEYFKNQSLRRDDKNAEDVGAPKPDYKRNQWGIGFGGPIVRDRVHFYGAIEYQTENKSFTVNTQGSRSSTASSKACFRPTTCGGSISCAATCSSRRRRASSSATATTGSTSTAKAAAAPTRRSSGSYVESPRDTNVTGHTWVDQLRALNEFRVQ